MGMGGKFQLIGPVPYRPTDFADWREGIHEQLIHARRVAPARDLGPGSDPFPHAVGAVSIPIPHTSNLTR